MSDMDIDLPPAGAFRGFPDDVLERVVDHVASDDWDSLLACSLVSKTMREKASFWLFEAIDIESEDFDKKHKKDVYEFWDYLLQEPVPDGAKFIKLVRMVAEEDMPAGTRSVSSTEISLMMNRCPNLRSVGLKSIAIHHREGPVHPDIPIRPVVGPVNGFSLDFLALHEVQDHDERFRARDVVELLSCFKRIDHLVLNLRTFGYDGFGLLAADADYTVAEDCLPRELEIKELELHLPGARADELASPLCRAICHTAAAQTLESLQILVAVDDKEIINVYNIFKTSARNVKDISLKITDGLYYAWA